MAKAKETVEETPKAEPKAAAVKTVTMTRQEIFANGGATEADVHPDEVENFKAGGWEVAK